MCCSLQGHKESDMTGQLNRTELMVFSFLRNLGIILHSGCINLHSHQHCKRVQYTREPGIEAPKCPSIKTQIKKMWHIFTMEYYSAIKRNNIMPFAETWMELGTVIHSKITQKEEKSNIIY